MSRSAKDSSKKTIWTSRQENDLNHAVQVTRVILRMIGVWPITKVASTTERIAVRLLNVSCYLLFAFILVPGLLLMFLKERDLKRRVRLSAPLLNCWIGSVKYSLLMYHAKEIQNCLEQVRQDWQDIVNWNDRKVMLSKAKIGRKLVLLSATFMYIGGLSYRTIVPLSKGRMLTPMNTTVRALACPSYFVKFDEQASPAYEIIFILQFFAGLVTYSVTCGTAGLAAFLIMHVCGQLAVLIGKFQRLNEMPEPQDRAVTTLLADIVEHQIKVKNFLKQVEEAMRYVWLVEIVGSTLLLCLVGYYIIMEWERSDSTAMLTMSVMLTSFTFSIFTVCYVGQLLTDQVLATDIFMCAVKLANNDSIEVGLMTSTTNWYRLPYKKARALIMIIAISNIPAKISAGRLIEMSLPTFSNILKTSMAYFNLLRKFI